MLAGNPSQSSYGLYFYALRSLHIKRMEQKKLSGGLTCFFPCFNDARTIEGLIKKAASIAEQFTPDFEVLVVDDGSTDGSREILAALAQNHPYLRVVFHERNLGYGAALRSGFQHATKEFVFYTDGDGQYDPIELERLVPLMTEGIDLVNGYKAGRQDSVDRKILGEIYAAIVKQAFSLKIMDPDCDFRLFRRALLPLELRSRSGAICVELLLALQNGAGGIEQIPVSHYKRKFGRSQFFNLRSILRTFRELGALWWDLRIHGR